MEKETLTLIQDTYKVLANCRNQWYNRHTAKGQNLLCRLRDVIARETGRSERDIQDEAQRD